MTATYSFSAPTRAQRHERFLAELRSALTRDGRTHRAIAFKVRCRPQTIREWLDGRQLPMPEVAVRLADELDAPHLARLVIEARTIECVICGRSAVAANKGAARNYCTPACKATANDRRKRGARVIDSHLTRHRLQDHQAAVAAMCRECTLGEGLCAQWQCPLRPVSPVPLSLAAQREQAAAEAKR